MKDNEMIHRRLTGLSSKWKSITLPKQADVRISQSLHTHTHKPHHSRFSHSKIRTVFTSTLVGLSGAALILLLGTQLLHVNDFTSASRVPSSGSLTTTIQLKAVKAQSDGTLTGVTVSGVHFVIVSANGQVVETRSGPGTVSVTVPLDGFWNSANKEVPLGTVGSVEILAYAPHMRDTIMVNVPVSPAPITDTPLIPMIPMVNPQGQNTPNEPYVVPGADGLHHLVTDAVSQYYSKYAHMTSSYLRKSQ